VVSASKPLWQQVTALVSLGASGTITGFSFVPAASADLMSPTNMPIRLMALERSAQPAPGGDAALRSAIVNVAHYYLRVAQGKTPAEMEAIIWQQDSVDGADHGASCAAFASLTLELAAHVVGQQSWVTGGTTYPWPLQKWADVRVDPNPDSPDIISVLQDAQAHGRWHPLGDGYEPQPGDWVLFDGHVEVVTRYADGVLDTIGGDSLPNFSVNAHQYGGALSAQGVAGFVNNGYLPPAAAAASAGHGHAGGFHHERGQASPAAAAVPGAAATEAADPAIPGAPGAAPAVPGAPTAGAAGSATPAAASPVGDAAIPGMPAAATGPSHNGRAHRRHPLATHGAAPAGSARTSQPAAATSPSHAGHGRGASGPGDTANAATSSGPAGRRPGSNASVPGMVAAGAAGSGPAAPSAPSADTAAAIPGLPEGSPAKTPAAPHDGHAAAPVTTPSRAAAPTTPAQRAFIDEVARGAMATQRRYGVPAAVTIAQAIDESGWGKSQLAVNGHNLFGIKGTGPAGSQSLPTQEYENGQWVTIQAPFRAYHNFAESIEDHGELLATSGYYTQAMANRGNPDAFANALTGVYATNPRYGGDLIQIMRQFKLYRYDAAGAQAPATPGARPSSSRPAGRTAPPGRSSDGSGAAGATPAPQPTRTRQPAPTSQPTRTPQPAPTSHPRRTPGPTRTPQPAPTSAPTRTPETMPSPHSTPTTTAPGGTPAAPEPTPDVPGLTPAPPQPKQSAAVTSAEPITLSFSYQHLSAAMPDTAASRPVQATVADALRPSEAPRAARAARAVRTARAERPSPALYHPHLPPAVKDAFVAVAKAPIIGMELVYRDVAGHIGMAWELLAACDWMQCQARPRFSPVHGEKLGTVNADRTVYRTKSEALEQCAYDLVELTEEIYGIDITAQPHLSVTDLANVFAAFRWGGLLKLHNTSAMEFPYSVAGLTAQLMNMRWPNIDESKTPDKPGGRFRMPFGAVPLVLSLHYPATV
jgi:flagellum-specific peptidoglycan hydrolase FlgJ